MLLLHLLVCDLTGYLHLSIDDSTRIYKGPKSNRYKTDVNDVISPTCTNPLSEELDLHLACVGEHISSNRTQVTQVTLGDVSVTREMDGAGCSCQAELRGDQGGKVFLIHPQVVFDVFCKYFVLHLCQLTYTVIST